MNSKKDENANVPLLYRLLKAVPLKQHNSLKDDYRQTKQKLIQLTQSTVSTLAHESEIERLKLEHDQVISSQNSRITKKSDEIKEKNDLLSIYVEIAKNYGIDIENIYKKKYSSNFAGIPVVHPQELAEPAILKQMTISFEKSCEDINLKEQDKPESEQDFIYISDAQKEMIFCNNRAACVLAGAGSGKSTSLILRVIFLNLYLHVPLNEITVCTFTTESRKDFMNKLIVRFQQWGKTSFNLQDAKKIVRTFHSLAWEANEYLSYQGKSLLFERDRNQVDNQAETDDEDLYDIPNFMEPRNTGRIGPDKTEVMLTETLKALYTENNDFREKLNNLYIYSLRLGKFESETNYNFSHEDELTQFCLKFWINQHKDLMHKILTQYPKSGNFVLNNDIHLNYHLYLPKLQLQVFLGLTYEQCKHQRKTFGSKKYPKKLSNLMKERNTLIARQVTTRYCTVYTEFELKQLIHLEEQNLPEKTVTYDSVPSFKFCCQGDFLDTKGERSLIHKQFENIIDFSYSIGSPLYTLSEDEVRHFSQQTKCNAIDSQFIQLAWLFHKKWMQRLDKENHTTFNDIFYDFSNPKHIAYNDEHIGRLSKYNHLLIDEFQDISSNIISFFRQIKRYLYTVQVKPQGSLTCIGDDLQSIYGWRGSSAQYITEFSRYFTTDHPHAEIPLEANYRSHPTILEKAQITVDKIRLKSPKSYQAKANVKHHQNPGCYFYPAITDETNSNFNKSYTINYELAFETLKNELKQRTPTQDKPIYILYRASNDKNSKGQSQWNDLLKKNANKIKVIKTLTIHSSKGLEADCVFVLGNISLPKYNPVREALYSSSPDISTTYYDMQVDEGHRLAYVAITRAKQVLHWFFKSNHSPENLVHYLLK